ncbi:MAG: hypothetical protein IJN83_03820 [Clostridia bacterium]|nr:hypothetical protein [Clostridia bacterium]
MQDSLYPPEPTPVPTPTPEPSPTPEPTLFIPKPEVNIYTARISVGAETVHGCLRVHYVNTGTDTIYSVPFHLYPNTITPSAFKIDSLSLDGKETYYVVDNDKLNVPLAVELAPGEDCVIFMEFDVDLYAGEYGADGKLEYILPAAAVYEHGWLLEAQPADVYYTAPASYSVIIEGEASCGLPQTETGHYYGENMQGLTVVLN